MASSLNVYPSLSGIAVSEIFTGYPLTMKQSSKKIALIAHDKKKSELLAWVLANKEELATHELIATGTTGKLIAKESGLPVQLVESGPYGGDIQIGAEMVENRIHALIFFWDPL